MEPIAKRLNKSAVTVVAAVSKPAKDDVTERIRRLEAELQSSSDSSSDVDDSDEEDDDSDEGGLSASSSDEDDNEAAKATATTKKAVLSLSAYANDRVEGLPEHLLPKATATAANLSDRKRKRDDPREPSSSASLLDVVQWPKKVPFACKPCGFVGKNMEDFQAHRESAEHLARQDNVGTVLMCKLCDKKFTSPQQLADHKLGKWHLQRAQQRKDRHVVKVCFDFVRGACKWGDRCNFEHTETKAMKKGKAFDKTKKHTCQQFERSGRCKYGDQCMFSHSTT